ncbi:alphaalpha-trehalose-phosphate synthase subunit TPS2 [Penicillium sp. IBT 35674x]|nr:alphaalpha-trehalose-phosphate synthase subunit TPS2 [Penicillium sp. IBT 35674x]
MKIASAANLSKGCTSSISELLATLRSFPLSVMKSCFCNTAERKEAFGIRLRWYLDSTRQRSEQATLSAQALHSIETLPTGPRNTFWILSGSDQDFLEKLVGHIRKLWLSTVYGCFIRKPRSDSWESLIELDGFDMAT